MYFKSAMLLLTILLAQAGNILAQQFGGDPTSIKWQQVNTPAARIIYPPGLDSAANRVADIIAYLNSRTQNSIGPIEKKIDIVLKNQTTVSNGFVTQAPFHSEFFLTPLQNSFDLGSIRWIETLAIHEFRHVQQYNNFNVGASKLFRILFGEAGQALANNVAIPNWFFEGDAVYSETNVTRQGRGRLPYFHNAFRSLWQANRKYSWMKLRNGSLKHFTPTHYALGYLLVSYGREKYGEEFWKKITHEAASFKGVLYPFQNAIKKHSGKTYVQFRNDALDFFREKYGSEKAASIQPIQPIYVNEEYPSFLDANTILFVKSSFSDVHSFVIRKGKEEKKIRVKDVSLDNHFSYRNGKIVYASYQPDKRWSNRDYSNLQLLDVKSGIQKTITHHSKYFAPDINEDGSKIVAVQVSPGGNSKLHLLNTDGNVKKEVSNPANLFYTYPRFYGDKIISAVKNLKGEMCIAIIDPVNGNTEPLTPYSFNPVGFPVVSGDTVYFTASNGEMDKLFACTMGNRSLFEFTGGTKEGEGKYQAAVSGHTLLYTTFTADGYRLQQTILHSDSWKRVDASSFLQPLSGYGITTLEKSNADLLSSVTANPLETKKYSKATGIINFHSIMPGVDDPEYSVTLVGNNILNTMQTLLGITYNRAEKWKRVGIGVDYGGWFPYLSAGMNYTFDRRSRYRGKTIFWNEMEPYAGISIPLNLSKGRSISFMNFKSNYVYNQSHFQGIYKDTLGKFSYSYLSNLFTVSNQVQKAPQNIYPRLAQTLSLGFKTALTRYHGSQFVANGNVFLPGICKNHSIVLNGGYLIKDTTAGINFSSGFPFSRGYQAENLHQMLKIGINYHLPLIYPDAGFASIIYLLRMRANIFYDHTHINDFTSNRSKFKADFRSTGIEIYFDTRWWNEAFATLGFRYSYLLDKDLFGNTGNKRWEFILPVNLFDQ